MTATATATQVADATREERRAALIELADLVDTEDRYCSIKPISPVLVRLVPALCSRKITDVQVALDMFGELVGAIAERRKYVSNERDFLLQRELPDTAATREAMHEHVQSDVDLWADRLMAAAR